MTSERMPFNCPPTSPELLELLEKARHYAMTPAERHAQRRSWVIGEMMLEHPEMTKEEAERLVDTALGDAR